MKISANKNVVELFQFILRDYSQLGEKEITRRLVPLKTEIEKCKTRISNARELMLDDQLEAKDYREIKDEYEAKIRKLEAKLAEMAFINSNVNEQLEFCSRLLPNVAEYYTTADLSVKQQIVGSIFPEKLIFQERSNQPRE